MSTPEPPAQVEVKDSTSPPKTHIYGDSEKAADTTDTATDEEVAAPRTDEAPPTGLEQQRWNESPSNIFRFLSCIFAFILLGMSDAVIGALIPYVSDITRKERNENRA